jgi:outer membrane protein assembly factor BamA
LLVGVLASTAYAQDCTELTTLSDAAIHDLDLDRVSEERPLAKLERSRPYVVGDVRIVRQEIFNEDHPEEDAAFHRWANRLHLNTREWVIKQAILMKAGESVTVETLEETERVLRRKSYLYDARVIPRRLCGDVLDLAIVTRDVWTLNPSLDFGSTGGESKYGLGLSDSNVLGTGRGAGVRYESDEDRTGVSVYYEDPNLAGTRTELDLLVENNDDGSRHFAKIERPFYSLDTRFSTGLRLDENRFEQGLFALSDEFATFRHHAHFASAFTGFSRGLENGQTVRWLAGYTYDENEFERIPGETDPVPFPQDRRYAYPWVGFEVVEDDFETSTNVNQINRTEDVYLGTQYSMHVGFSDHRVGGDDQTRWAIDGTFRNGIRFGDRHLMIFGIEGRGFWNVDEDEEEDVFVRAYVNHRMTQSPHFSLYSSLGAAYVRNLPEDEQLLIGGEEGLRGYPNRYQEGDRRMLFTLEERYFSDLYLWRVLRVGAAVFLDVGRAWFPHTTNDEPFGTLIDVGFGLRIESTRTRSDRLLHIDLAFPLQDGPEVGSHELSLTVKQTL